MEDLGIDQKFFMPTQVKKVLEVVQSMLSDIDRRRLNLGVRIAAKDLENCLGVCRT